MLKGGQVLVVPDGNRATWDRKFVVVYQNKRILYYHCADNVESVLVNDFYTAA